MANFRPASVIQGQPLGMTSSSVMLNATYTTGTPYFYDAEQANIALLYVYSDNATATNRVLQLLPAKKVGYQLMVMFAGTVGNKSNIQYVNNAAPPTLITYSPSVISDFILLVSNGTGWTRVVQTVNLTINDTGALTYSGTWDSNANLPLLTNPPSASAIGDYYVVNVPGNQFGTDWGVGDWIVAGPSAWQQIDNSEINMPLTDSHIYVGNASDIATDVAMTGVIKINNAGVTAFNGAISVEDLEALTASRAVVSDSSGFLASSSVTSTELGYVSGVTSGIQGQLDSKIPEAAGAIVNTDVNAVAAIEVTKFQALTAARAVVTDGSGFISPATTTATEIGYVNGVTSAIQTQLNAKIGTALTTGYLLVGVGDVATPLAPGGNGSVLTIVAGVPTWVP